MLDLPADIFSTSSRVVFFPVRHHSPAAARLVSELADSIRPAAILIEGPADYNARLDELALAHDLPIAIYSYARRADGQRRGAYYPFCIYSPEWQAFLAGRRLHAHVQFIDLPYADIVDDDEHVNRYADADLRRSRYVAQLCRQLGVDGLDALWDTLVEVETALSVENYLRRAHQFCGSIRLLEGEGRLVDRRREAFMAGEIRSAIDRFTSRILVVTGGYHSLALYARINGLASFLAEPATWQPSPPAPDEERGIALTPYSYERLDGLRGYDAGMPNPGFYDRLWQDRSEGTARTHRGLLVQVAKKLRERKQRISSADLIAAETCATGLARLRGHEQVWRSDLVDGLATALVKDELAAGGRHPMLDAVHEVLRGDKRGMLAEGTALPPLVQDMRRQLGAHQLQPEPAQREVGLDLSDETGRERSRLMHRMRILGVAGFARKDGTDFTGRADLSRVWEKWEIRWSPDYDSSAIEAARYGATLADAAAARLAEQAAKIERSAAEAAALLLDAALGDLNSVAGDLHQQVQVLIRSDGEFVSLTGALGHLLFLYHYDDTLGSRGRADVGQLLREAFGRSLWLLETLGQMGDAGGAVIRGIRQLLETFDRCDSALALSRTELVDVLTRVERDKTQLPPVRGAAVGALWTLGEADLNQVRADLKLFADPERLGDFLTGLFALAREVVQRQADLILAIDDLLVGYADDDFLLALPSLRLAFTYFTPREKHYLATSLLEALGIKQQPSVAALEVDPEDAARAMALESRVFAAVQLYGLRGGKS